MLEAIRDKLQKEPLKWRVITNILIVTGCRRGEIMGLKWSAVDFEKRALHTEIIFYTKQR
ncbi:MAG: tyrosine-type recombinase/integrase [Oscillospiraceae bacterium]